MINTIIALLVEAGYFTPEEGELIAQKVRQGTLPHDYKSSARQVHQWVEEAKAGK